MADRRPYKRKAGALPPVTFNVETSDGTVSFTAKHLRFHENAELNDSIIGEVKEKSRGKKELLERILKLDAVVVAIDTGEPDDEDLAACTNHGKLDVRRYLNLPGNENLAWLAYAAWLGALDGPTSKSGDEDSGESVGDSGGAAKPNGRADTYVSTV